MKNVLKFLLIVSVFANTFTTSAQNESLDKNYFQLSPRVGYDFPNYDNNTPFIDYKAGLDLGISLDYYWNWLGLGIDFDYIKNTPESTYLTSSLYEPDGFTPINTFSLSEDAITRMFYGIGPNAQFRTNTGKFKAEVNTRFGLASIKGGRTYLEGASTLTPNIPLNFHAGYDDKSAFTFKGQLRFTYFLSKSIGINAGAYYMRHFKVDELVDPTLGISAKYTSTISTNGITGEPISTINEEFLRGDACDCDISSVGVFAGITIKLNKKDNICPVCKEDHKPHCCATCDCDLTIIAKDKITGVELPNTEVVLVDLYGNIAKTGTTNSHGIVVFNEVKVDDYLVKGKLYDISLDEGGITKADFKSCQKDGSGIQKVIVYSDENFILKGKVVECNTTQGIQGVDVKLLNKMKAGQINTLSNADGNFNFHLNQSSTYLISGKKDGYYSNEVEVSTYSHDRTKSLFIDFEMCVDPCGRSIKLENITFDLNKSEILPAAIPDLQRVVNLMKDNPFIKVEMSSHTDSQGGDSYNQSLSQRRANATVSYIVSQGISRSRLIARGAGESELKNEKCANNVPCTDEEHRVNRRTEFKIECL